MKILFVEDDPLQSHFVSRVLANNLVAPLQLVRHSTLGDALHCLHSESFDVVLLDLMLPDSSGLPTFTNLAAANPMLPVVVLTNLDDEQSAIEALRRGAQDYLLKGEQHGGALVRSLRYAIERQRRVTAEQQVAEAQEAERKRLARELHDGVIQSLSSMRLQLQMLARQTDSIDRSTADSIRQMADTTLGAINDVRRVSRDLHPAVLENRDLGDALVLLGKRLQAESSVPIRVIDRCRGELSRRAKHHLYRIFQEAVRNAIRHAAARQIEVRLENRDDALVLEIRDDGRGFDVQTVRAAGSGLGLISLYERAQLLGGSTQITAQHDGGTTVLVRIPAGRDYRPQPQPDQPAGRREHHPANRDTVKITITETRTERPIAEDEDAAAPSHIGR